MKTNPHHPTGFGSCSDRALAEKATAFYDAISNHTGLASSLPGFETFNAARLASYWRRYAGEEKWRWRICAVVRFAFKGTDTLFLCA